nr:imidazolonepropionase [Permianibacter aggregans]
MQGKDYGLVENGEMQVADGRIQYIGAAKMAPDNGGERIDLQGALITPGLIDCHTHLVYGGHRANEFEMRLNGASYADIAKAGGGIVSTVAATRAASVEILFEQASKRLKHWLAEGVTTIEIKSGYGLDLASERKMLQVATRLGEQHPISVRRTFLGAHAVPPEFAGKADQYLDYLIDEVLPTLHQERLVDAVDVFCESIGFSWAQSERMLEAARRLSLPIKIHAEQLSNLQGAKKAAEMDALSADHLEFLNPVDVPTLAKHGTVAVLLPAAFYFLRETKLPPMEALRQHKVPIALASDSNPGSSPAESLLLMLNMACTLFRMTPLEALQGVTIHAAKALGAANEIGSLERGKFADFAVFDCQHPAELSYRIGANSCIGRGYRGAFSWR